VGVGAAVPSGVVTNTDLERLVETSDDWIAARTGIRQRHVLGPGESLASLSADACRQALDMSGVSPEDVDMVLMCTSSPDDAFGSACAVQDALGCANAVAFDITAACSGFVVGAITATQYIRAGAARNVLVIGADVLSQYVDWRDRGTCILFGDGAGAVVMTAAAEGEPCAVLGFDMGSDGSGRVSLRSDSVREEMKPMSEAGASAKGAYCNIEMNGQEVFKFAVRTVPSTLEKALGRAGLEPSAIDWLVMHQANQRILDGVAKRFDIPAGRVVSNIAQYGNTSAGSIPIALNEAVRDGRIKKGELLATAGFGAGLTWASALVRWG